MLNTLGFYSQDQTYMKDITTSSCANKQPLLKWTHPRIADSLNGDNLGFLRFFSKHNSEQHIKQHFGDCCLIVQ